MKKYEIEPNNKFFHAARSIVEKETSPGSTIRFTNLVDLTEIEEIRDEWKASGRAKPTYPAFVIKAVGIALREYPYANRRVVRRPWLFFLGPRLQKFHHCDVAVAVEPDTPGMVFSAFIDIVRDADRLELQEIVQWLHVLARSDEIANEQWQQFRNLIQRLPWPIANLVIRLPYWFPNLWVKYRGGSVLLSSPAKYGVDMLAADWSSPMAVSFGMVKDRPMVVGGEVVPRASFYFHLNFDRRIMAGAPGAKFFARIIYLLTHAKSTLTVNAP